MINLWPTNTEFYLDTFKFSKKYLLRFKYPQDIEVNASEAEPVFKGDYLTVTFPILQIRDNFNDKVIRKKGYQAENSDRKSNHKKKTNAPTDNTVALSLVDSINDKEDKTREQKLQKEKEKYAYFAEKEKQKELKKRKREQLRNKSLQEIKKSTNPSSKKKQKRPPPKKQKRTSKK